MSCGASLSKFGPPLPGAGNAQVGLLQPKIKNRFRVRTVNFGPPDNQDDLTHNIQSVDRPTISQSPVEVHSYNSIAYYAGKHVWNEINMVMRDDITNNATRLVAGQLQKQVNHCQQQSVPAGVNYKFTMFLETLDGQSATPFEIWTLEGCFLSNTTYDSMEYSDSQPLTINCTVRYDNATYNVMEEFETIDQSNSILSFPFTPGITGGGAGIG